MNDERPNQICFFQHAFVDRAWADNVCIAINADGWITDVATNCQAPSSGSPITAGGVAIPGMPNVHSHAFQWTFAGKSEFRTRERDSFWSWREQMYQSVRQLSPDQYYQRACQLYRMMLWAGYTSVGEFHYIHNDENGEPYDRRSELADQLIRAATGVGISICMLPVLYQRGGFDNSPLTGTQRRFELSAEALIELCAAIQDRWADHPLVSVGMAFHSMRAVDPETIQGIAQTFHGVIPGGPIHIHVAEQIQEVDDCLATTGKRPVEWLLENVDIDRHWCLIHATHMTDDETARLAETGAVVGVCPTTEANLGDGVFSARQYLRNGGRIAIGSDSHVAVDPGAELRLLEYGQRLTTHQRAVLCTEAESCGQHLYEQSVRGGNQIMGQSNVGQLAVGQRADLVELDLAHPVLAGSDPREFFDRYVFCQWGRAVRRTMVGGQWIDG